jgi:4-diphosphocytidyl-2-C-methyl-D-erythritol kinase
MPAPLRLSCPAKVNLALSVARPHAHTGLHPIASWMVALTFADTLSLARADGDASRFDIAFDEDSPADAPRRTVDWPLEQDLAFRAHALLESHTGRRLPIDAVLRKRIPTGAGLGGGSSNAAAMLVGVNRLFGLALDEPMLIQLAGRIGSDVAFFVGAQLGRPSAIVSGLGEIIEPAPLAEVVHLVLAFPPFGCPTGPVYKAFDAQFDDITRIGAEPDIERVRALGRSSPLPPDGPFNDLAEPACIVEPRLRDTLHAARAALPDLRLHVTGSGSTLFLIAPSAITAQVLARKVTALTTLPAIATRTL